MEHICLREEQCFQVFFDLVPTLLGNDISLMLVVQVNHVIIVQCNMYQVYKELLSYMKRSPLTLRNHILQRYTTLDTLLILLTLAINV